MERLNRAAMGCAIALIVATTGCRTPRSEVPPGPSMMPKDPPTATAGVEFGSDPHQSTSPPGNLGMPNSVPNGSRVNPYNNPGAGTPPGTFGGTAVPGQVSVPPKPFAGQSAPTPAAADAGADPVAGLPAINP